MSGSAPARAGALALAALAGWGAARLPDAAARLGEVQARLTTPEPIMVAAGAAPPGEASRWLLSAPAPLPLPPAPPVYLPWPVMVERPYPVWMPSPAAPAPATPASMDPGDRLAALPAPQPMGGQMAGAVSPPAPPEAGALATAAYERLAAGDRRAAARLFDAAFAADPDGIDPRWPQWRQDARALRRRWSGEGWMLVRAAPADLAAGVPAAPILGGGQTGGTLAWTPDPLARRPLAVVARFNAGSDGSGAVDRRTAQAALGVRWQLLPGVALAGERLISAGDLARDAWLLRLSGGGTRRLGAAAGVPLRLEGYGEASLLDDGDWLAGGQGRLLGDILGRGSVSAGAGLGGWGSVQSVGGQQLGRLDVGPSAQLRVARGRLAFDVSADYRQRVAGSAEPGSGPVLTLSTNF